MEMEKLIEQILEEKSKSPEIKEALDKAIDKSICNAIESLTGWNSDFNKAIKAKIEPLLNSRLELTSLDKLVSKVTMAINQSSIIKTIDDRLSDYLRVNNSVKEFDYGQKVDLEDLIQAYSLYAKNRIENDIDKDSLEYEEGSATVYFDISAELIAGESGSYFDKTYLLKAECEDIEDFNCDVQIKLDYQGRLHYDYGNMKLADIMFLDTFFLYLFNLEEHRCSIENFERLESYSEEFDVSIEDER